MEKAISKEYLESVFNKMDISDISKTTIRQCVAVANDLEDYIKEKFLHLEIGVPGIGNCLIGNQAQKEAIDNGVTSIYPPISGIAPLKKSASKFIKAFTDIDISPSSIVPTVGSMQGCYNLFLECSQLDPTKDTILFINPGFPANFTQLKVLGIKGESFDIYNYRAEKLKDKLEEYLSKGNIAAILYSNPNNPAWICLTEKELEIIGECANKYDVIVLEDMAYLCMDFRHDLSKPNQPPFHPSVAKYTSNYILLISGSKIFSYAGERIAVMAFSDKLFNREYSSLRAKYGLGKMGDNFILTYLYCASSGCSHSSQYALAAMFEAAANGEYDFVKNVSEYGRRAKLSKEIFVKHGFNIVYDKDIDQEVGDGFFYTIAYKNLTNKEILTNLLRSGITAITLNTTGSLQAGIRVCVSQLTNENDFIELDKRLQIFVDITD